MADNSKSNWSLIIIADQKNLPGQSIFQILQTILQVVKYQYVIIDDIIGAGVSNLINKENEILKVEDLLAIVREVIQFDWGDFFLFEEYPKFWKNTKNMTYAEVIIQTDTTIRAIDDGYIYVYTPSLKITNKIQENYIIDNISSGPLKNLSYPY